MKFSLASDLHVDFPHRKRLRDYHWEDLIILAGDTSNGLGDGPKFINKMKNRGHQVFAIDGNHDHYANRSRDRSIVETEHRFYDLVGNGHFQRLSDDLCIIGYNGWYQITDPSSWVGYMNDCSAGDETEVWDASERHVFHLRNTLGSWPGKAIVVTHTAPTMETLDPRFDGHFSNEWYWNPALERVLIDYADKIAIWCHGHTHAAADKIVHGVRVVCNPRGYPGENPNWEPLTIEL